MAKTKALINRFSHDPAHIAVSGTIIAKEISHSGCICGYYIRMCNAQYTLPPTPNYLTFFMLVQKVKIGHKNNASINKQRLCRDCKLFHLKMTCTFCTDDVRVKVSSFQKVTQFLQYKTFQRDIIRLIFCLFEDIPDCLHLRRIIFKSFASI